MNTEREHATTIKSLEGTSHETQVWLDGGGARGGIGARRRRRRVVESVEQ